MVTEMRVLNLENTVKDLEDQAKVMRQLIEMLATSVLDGYDKEFGPEEQKNVKELLSKL